MKMKKRKKSNLESMEEIVDKKDAFKFENGLVHVRQYLAQTFLRTLFVNLLAARIHPLPVRRTCNDVTME